MKLKFRVPFHFTSGRSVAAFAVMFGALGAAFAFGDWLVPQEYLIWFATLWLGGWVGATIGRRLDQRACEAAGSEQGGVAEPRPAPDRGGRERFHSSTFQQPPWPVSWIVRPAASPLPIPRGISVKRAAAAAELGVLPSWQPTE